jgi:hypothetical protein
MGTRASLKKGVLLLILFCQHVLSACSVDSLIDANIGGNLIAGTVVMGQVSMPVTCGQSGDEWTLKASGLGISFSMGYHTDYYVTFFADSARTQMINPTSGISGVGSQNKTLYFMIGRSASAYNPSMTPILDTGSFSVPVPFVLSF